MFLIKSDDNFLTDHLLSILNNKKKLFTGDISKKIFGQITLEKKDDLVSILFNQKKINLKFPIIANDIFNEFINLISDYYISIGNIYYYPLRGKVSYKKKSIKLNFIHDQIIYLLVINSFEINKNNLYKLIWQNDYEVSMNKLDTHITNLKNILKKDLNFNLFVKTEGGKVYLVIQ